MRNVWARYDAEESGSKVFSSLVTALKRLVTEKPALLGVNTQMLGVGVPPPEGAAGYSLDVGGVAGMVANAASATMSGMVGMMGAEAGLSVQNSAMKLQWSVAFQQTRKKKCADIDTQIVSINWTRPILHQFLNRTSIF